MGGNRAKDAPIGAGDAGNADAPSMRRASERSLLGGEILRFLIVGGVNTLVGYGVYLLLLPWLRYEFAYAFGYLAGIAVSYALSSLFVFRQPLHARSAARFPLVYVVQFVVSLGVLRLAVETFGVPHWLALAVSIAVTLPLTFVLSRWIVRAR